MEGNAEFGSNPGNLGMYSCVPRGLAKSSALVVALHGGQQTARDFDLATGWSTLGRKHGFAVMFPEQKCANNSQNCFNWFIERHISPNEGEIASIRAMIEKMLRDYKLDRSRVFVTGLSAGGAMACASCFLSRFVRRRGNHRGPPLWSGAWAIRSDEGHGFRAGAVFAGMGESGGQASPGQTKWPKISIWHGSHDEVVAPANGSALVRQWIDIHQVDEAGAALDEVDGQTRVSWRDSTGTVVVELYAIDGMAHGVPIDAKVRGLSRPLALSCSTPEFRLPFTSPNHGDFCGKPPPG
ncbi:MAG: PHB depolymerase family esterase [Pseudomonadota bacterium]|nr:PHB depolymerase family esterase [Pseudomonadota bacterium]